MTQNRNNAVRPNDNAVVDAHASDKPSIKVDDRSLVGGGNGALATQHDEINLREWLTPRCHMLDKLQRLQMFKQILKLVDTSHSQGLVLQHLRPSYFLISPSNQVRYVGPFVPQIEQVEGSFNQDIDNYLEPYSKRKNFWHDNCTSSPKHQKLGESYKTPMMSGSVLSTSDCQHPTLEFLKLEEKWCASPEELNNGPCSFSSNIYSLGVLFFEYARATLNIQSCTQTWTQVGCQQKLFCYFDSWEVHSAAMSDLRYRILPPSFLSESPEEAGFCLWLLHPGSSSRPNSWDILLSDFTSEGQELSFPDHSYEAIDEEDAEADFLLHFLLNMKEQKGKQAAKLVADIECLTGDIEEVEKRYSSKTESVSEASAIPMNSNEISNKYPQGPMHVEGTSRYSMSMLSGRRLMRNFDQLENAYFSMRSKIEIS